METAIQDETLRATLLKIEISIAVATFFLVRVTLLVPGEDGCTVTGRDEFFFLEPITLIWFWKHWNVQGAPSHALDH